MSHCAIIEPSILEEVSELLNSIEPPESNSDSESILYPDKKRKSNNTNGSQKKSSIEIKLIDLIVYTF